MRSWPAPVSTLDGQGIKFNRGCVCALIGNVATSPATTSIPSMIAPRTPPLCIMVRPRAETRY